MIILLQLPEGESINFIPGQFVNIIFEKKIARAYSIANYSKNPTGDLLELCIEYVEGGKASEYLKLAEIGEIIEFKYPFGRFIPFYYDTKSINNSGKSRVIFIGTGTGIVPLYCMLNDLAKEENASILDKNISEIYVFHGVKNEEEIYFDRRFLELKQLFETNTVRFHYNFWVSQATDKFHGNKGRFTNELNKIIPQETDKIYICGNGTTCFDIKSQLVNNGYKDFQIYMERYN